MNNIGVRIVCVAIAVGMVVFSASGVQEAMRFGALPHLVAKRVALLLS